MKKIFFVFLIFSLLLCSCSSSPPDDWQTICIENCGTMKIPKEWTVLVEDDLMYIMNGEKPVMVFSNTKDNKGYNKYWGEYEYIEITARIRRLSKFTECFKAKYKYDDIVVERYLLHLRCRWHEHTLYRFIVLDTEISEELLIQIAETFVWDGVL